jgi:hypothetical protein
MSNETTPGQPLTATVGEQLGEKGHHPQMSDQARQGPSVPGAATAPAGGVAAGRPRRHAGGGRWVPLAFAAIGWVLAQNLAHGLGRRIARARKSVRRRWR